MRLLKCQKPTAEQQIRNTIYVSERISTMNIKTEDFRFVLGVVRILPWKEQFVWYFLFKVASPSVNLQHCRNVHFRENDRLGLAFVIFPYNLHRLHLRCVRMKDMESIVRNGVETNVLESLWMEHKFTIKFLSPPGRSHVRKLSNVGNTTSNL